MTWLPACRAQIAQLEETCNRQYATAEESAREWAEVTNNANIHKGEPSLLKRCCCVCSSVRTTTVPVVSLGVYTSPTCCRGISKRSCLPCC